VELRGLEPLTPCLQIGLSTHGQGADLVSKLSVSIREVPLVTEVNGTLMARLPVVRQACPQAVGQVVYDIRGGAGQRFA
jgi:hypothetical protein